VLNPQETLEFRTQKWLFAQTSETRIKTVICAILASNLYLAEAPGNIYIDEHNPPHFHIQYNEYRASMDIKNLNITVGLLPAKVRGLEEWAELHRDELLLMWGKKEFHRIQPLV